MKLTGKCKQSFDNWYLAQDYCTLSLTEYNEPQILRMFYVLDISFKYGVYIDFFKSVNIDINVVRNRIGTYNSWCALNNDWDVISRALPTQECVNKARIQTVLEANKLYKECIILI